MRKVWLPIIILTLLVPVVASAAPARNKTVRCGWSLGFGFGPAINTDHELKEEFNVPFDFEFEAKYYLWKPFSLALSMGYLYGEGKPEGAEWHGERIVFDREGNSFWRAFPMNALARVEIGRYWMVNPYLGGGGGMVYNSLWRKGLVREVSLSDSDGIWVPDYLGLVGIDVAVHEFVALKLEGRWSFIQIDNAFFDQRDWGSWTVLVGIQIYL